MLPVFQLLLRLTLAPSLRLLVLQGRPHSCAAELLVAAAAAAAGPHTA
jgi:hypothetical protein